MEDQSNRKSIIVPTHIFGPIEYYALYMKYNVIWEAHENYQKKSIRNRFSIKAINKPLNISIPLNKGKNQQLPIVEVRINYDGNWHIKLLQTIKTYYHAAPYFEYYFDDLSSIILSKHSYLWDLNYDIHLYILNAIGIDCNFYQTKSWSNNYESIFDFRKTLNLNYSDYKYFQIPDGTNLFLKGLSVIDLLFCAGPESRLILKNILIRIS